MTGNQNVVGNYLFDLDGTLFHTRAANFQAYRRAFAETGRELSEEVYQRFFGLRLDDMLHQAGITVSPADLDIIKRRKVQYYRDMMPLVKPNTVLLDFIKQVSPSARIALVTTAGKNSAHCILEHFGLVDAFDATVFGEEVQESKPHPACYHLCLEKLQTRPEQCLAFEDSEAGIEAASRAGIKVVRITLGEA